MIALEISPQLDSLYGLDRQVTKLYGFVWNLATFARLPFEQFSTENSSTWLSKEKRLRHTAQKPGK